MGNPSKFDDEEDEEEVEYITNVVLGIQAPQKFPAKVLSEEEKRIWSAVTWPSSLAEVLHQRREMAKVKTKLTIDAFRTT